MSGGDVDYSKLVDSFPNVENSLGYTLKLHINAIECREHYRQRSFIERGQSSAKARVDIGSLQLPKQTRRQVKEYDRRYLLFSKIQSIYDCQYSK